MEVNKLIKIGDIRFLLSGKKKKKGTKCGVQISHKDNDLGIYLSRNARGKELKASREGHRRPPCRSSEQAEILPAKLEGAIVFHQGVTIRWEHTQQ